MKPWDSQSVSKLSLRSMSGISVSHSQKSLMNLDRLAQRNIQNQLMNLPKPANKVEIDLLQIIKDLENDVKAKQKNIEESKIEDRSADTKYTKADRQDIL